MIEIELSPEERALERKMIVDVDPDVECLSRKMLMEILHNDPRYNRSEVL